METMILKLDLNNLKGEVVIFIQLQVPLLLQYLLPLYISIADQVALPAMPVARRLQPQFLRTLPTISLNREQEQQLKPVASQVLQTVNRKGYDTQI